MYRFIAQRNVGHFEDLLRTETDPKRRAILLRLLIAEEKMLGEYSPEHLAKLDGHILRIEELISKQRDLVAKLNGDGRSATLAVELLNMLMDTHDVFRRHRTTIENLLRE